MSEKREAVLRRVRGLLAKAEAKGVTPEEAETLTEKATALMARYAIDLALVQAKSEHAGETPGVRRYSDLYPYPKTRAMLLGAIARGFGCEAIWLSQSCEVDVFGYESDLAMVDLLFSSLLVQGTGAMLKQPRSDRSFRVAFWYGFANRVGQRLQEQRRAATEEAAAEAGEPGTALVLRDRTAQVKHSVAERYPRLRSSKTKVNDGHGYGAGKSAADRVDLGGTRVGGGDRTALSA